MENDKFGITNNPPAGDPAATAAAVPTTGMSMVQNAVIFTNEQVLQSDAKPFKATSKLLADQAAAMMIEDVRAYLQGSEQMLTAAAAQGFALIIAGEETKGTAVLAQVTAMQTALPIYAATIGATAITITSDFV